MLTSLNVTTRTFGNEAEQAGTCPDPGVLQLELEVGLPFSVRASSFTVLVR